MPLCEIISNQMNGIVGGKDNIIRLWDIAKVMLNEPNDETVGDSL